jgi:tetratricopeptide (TPR) repeat protein
MDIQRLLDQVHGAGGDPQKLTLTTLDIALSVHGPDLRPVIEAAAIPHWFDQETLARMLVVDQASAERYVDRVRRLSMVESFAARGGWNVHETTRLAVRRDLYANQPERFRRLSSAASKCFPGATPHEQIESVYHRLSSEPAEGGDQLKALHFEWFETGRSESRVALAQALDELLKSTPPAFLTRASCLIYLAKIRQGYSNIGDTELLLREALALLEGNNDVAESTCRDYLGDTLQQGGRLSAALTELLKAREIRRRAGEIDSDSRQWIRDTLYSHSRVGRIYCGQSRFDEADIEYREGLRTTQQLTERFPDDPLWQRVLVLLYIDIGNLYAIQGKNESALESYRAALQTSQGLADRDSDNWEWQHDLGVAHGHVGRMCSEQRNSEMAFSELRRAIDIDQRLVLQFPDDKQLQNDLSYTQSSLGDAYRDRGEFEEALKHYRAALDIAQRITQQVTDNLDWQRALVSAHFSVGFIYEKQKRLADALTEHEIGLDLAREIALRDPGNALTQRDLQRAHSCIGRFYELQEEFEKALNEYTEGATIAQRLAQDDPRNPEWKYMLAISLIDVAIIHKSTHRRASARDGFSRAANLLRELAKLDPTRKNWDNIYRFALQQLSELGHTDQSE